MRSRRWIKPLCLLLAAAWLAWWLSGPWRPARRAILPIASTRTALRSSDSENPYRGSPSCAAARCHGGAYDPNQPAWRWAYTLWRADDPHAQAHADLLSPRGQEIARRYFAAEPAARAERDQRCLACHVTPDTPEEIAISEGVGCESCHGPSDRWHDEHYLPAWKERRTAEGFHDLRPPTARAKACVGCHVGSPGQEVNHDLIAAGHPPLRFEFSAYHEQMPKHWNEHPTLPPNPEPQFWLAGQIESGRAALELLEHRAGNRAGVWPEFAEYDCESCHHPLAAESWRQSFAIDGSASRQAGRPLWGTWHFSPQVVEAWHALRERPRAELETVEAELTMLRNKMASLDADRDEIRALVEVIRSAWSPGEVSSVPSVPNRRASTALELLFAAPRSTADRTWSATAQRWLAQTAYLHQDAQHMELLRAIRRQLAEPGRFDPAAIESNR